MSKDKMLYKEVADIFDGYHPLAVFKEGKLYINYNSIRHLNTQERLDKLNELVQNGPECWQLEAVVLGTEPEDKPMMYRGLLNPA